jgi:hypothetical protein
MSICREAYPHIFDKVIEHADYGALIALRGACRDVRDRVDAALVKHLAIKVPFIPQASWEWRGWTLRDYFWSVRGGEHLRIPRKNWYDLPALTDSVEIVDIHTQSDRWACSLAEMQEEAAEFRLRGRSQPLPPRLPPSMAIILPPTCVCWCSNEPVVELVLELLGARFTKVRLVRRWGLHICEARHHISSPREVAFVLPAWIGAMAVPMSRTSVLHVGFNGVCASVSITPW